MAMSCFCPFSPYIDLWTRISGLILEIEFPVMRRCSNLSSEQGGTDGRERCPHGSPLDVAAPLPFLSLLSFQGPGPAQHCLHNVAANMLTKRRL